MQQLQVPRPSAVGIILAASDISGPVDLLGELPAWASKLMSLPESVTTVQANNEVMFHLAEKQTNELRSDTSTYQWFGKCARAVVQNPHTLIAGNSPRKYLLIGSVEPPNHQYPTIRHLTLVLKFVPSHVSRSGTPEIWLQSMRAQSQRGINPSLKKALGVAPNE